MSALPGADFASMLDEVLAEEDEADKASLTASVDYLSVVEELHSGRIHFSDAAARSEYRANQEAQNGAAGSRAEMAAPSIDPSLPLPSTDPADIARELGIGRASAARDLDHLRREFAFRNHPDRVTDDARARAIVRMQIANMLIDEAKRAGVKSSSR